MKKEDNSRLDTEKEELQNLFHEVEHHKEESTSENTKEIDVLNLPPRKEVHQNKKSVKLTWSKPFIRFAFILFLLFLCLIAALYIGDGDFSSFLHRL
jgi:hypothetical protein